MGFKLQTERIILLVTWLAIRATTYRLSSCSLLVFKSGASISSLSTRSLGINIHVWGIYPIYIRLLLDGYTQVAFDFDLRSESRKPAIAFHSFTGHSRHDLNL